MAKDPHEAVDFAPAWLNFNNSNKKKTEKSSGIHGSSQSSSSNPLKSSQEPVFRSSLGTRSGGSPSRSTGSGVHWGHHSPSGRPSTRHQSVDFSPSYGDKTDLFSPSPNKDHKNTFSRSANFSPTIISAKRDFSNIHTKHSSRNGHTPARPAAGMGDSSPALDADFPSLSDIDISDQNKAKQQLDGRSSSPMNVVNMWKKPLVVKTTESQSSSNSSPTTKSQAASSIYKTLVPKSSANHQKPYRRTMSVPLNLTSKSGNSVGELIPRGSKREHSAIGRQYQSPSSKIPVDSAASKMSPQTRTDQRPTVGKTLSVDIGVVSGHKKHRKGKSHFLKTLRQTESGDDSAGGVNFSDTSGESVRHTAARDPPITTHKKDIPAARPLMPFSNGRSEHDPTGHKYASEQFFADSFHQLSSSLEAEHRLLREMGWNTDSQGMGEEAPLTEDEIQEFKIKCNGLLSAQASGKRKEAFSNAFSDWKFSGIKKKAEEESYRNDHMVLPTQSGNPLVDGGDIAFSDDDASGDESQ